jgi:hypothetical protein
VFLMTMQRARPGVGLAPQAYEKSDGTDVDAAAGAATTAAGVPANAPPATSTPPARSAIGMTIASQRRRADLLPPCLTCKALSSSGSECCSYE